MKRNQKRDESTYEPFKIDENFNTSLFLNPTKEQIVKSLKRKFITKLKNLKPFVDVMKYKTSSNGVSICPISSNSKLWNIVYGSQRKVSRVVQYSCSTMEPYKGGEAYVYDPNRPAPRL